MERVNLRAGGLSGGVALYQDGPFEELAQLNFFSMTKCQPEGKVSFRITVKEFAVPPAGQRLRFFAEADKQVNQNSAALLPSGWGDSV